VEGATVGTWDPCGGENLRAIFMGKREAKRRFGILYTWVGL
jgi:hypothetical protein